MNTPRFFQCLFLLFWMCCQACFLNANYKIESVFSGYDGDKKIYLFTLFLPYNPSIVSYSTDPKVEALCKHWWPKGDYRYSDSDNECDLLWIAEIDDELTVLKEASEKVKKASAIFTTTHLSHPNTYPELKSYLESQGYALIGHWYLEHIEGQAMFVKRELFEAAMNTLNYVPSNFCVASTASHNNLTKYFKKAENKPSSQDMPEIDCIYMINLDERPEKFERTAGELALFGIYPYRFSAVNGWKLSVEDLNAVGVKFTSDFSNKKFLGSIYREIDGEESLGNEIIRPNGETFFSLGMSHGAVGIVLSHLSILQDAYDSGYQTIWVMEDDVEAVANPLLLSELIPKLDFLVGDWDILFTDTDTKDHNGNHVACRALAARPNVDVEPLSAFLQRFYSISDDFSRIGMRYGAYSMIVRRSGMEKILNYFKTYGIFIPYDMDIWLNPELKMYSTNYDIVSHRPGSPTDNSYPNYLKK